MSSSSFWPLSLLLLCLASSSLIMKTTTETKVETTAVTKAEPVDLHRLIRCLEEVEGGQWNWPGGKLRISRAFWHDHGKTGYIHACDPTKARETVARGLAKYVHDLAGSDVEPSVQLLARCYNMGWNGAMHDPKAKSDYAERVANLYFDPSFKEAL